VALGFALASFGPMQDDQQVLQLCSAGFLK